MNRTGDGSRSITKTLLICIALPLAILVFVSAMISAIMANRSVNRLYDQQMQSIAKVLLTFILYETKEIEDDDDEEEYEEDDDLNEDLLEVVSSIEKERGLPVNFRLTINGNTLFTSVNLNIFSDCADGLSQLRHPSPVAESIDWYCYRENQSLLGSRYNVSVEVFEPAQQRKQDVRSLIIATFSPFFLLSIVVLLLTAWAVSYAMKSLKQVSSDVADRSVRNLKRLPIEGQPAELLPVVRSVNALLGGIERGFTREKQFTDDAAHELRTPLTSIKMVEQLLRRDNKDPALSKYLDNLRDSVEQSNDLIEQLLGFCATTVSKVTRDESSKSE